MDKQAKKAGKGKALTEKPIQTIDIDKDKPYDNKVDDPEMYHNEDNAEVFYEAGSYSTCIIISDIATLRTPQEWELCLKYKDKDVRIIGSDKKIFCESVPEHTDATLKSAVKVFSRVPWEAE